MTINSNAVVDGEKIIAIVGKARYYNNIAGSYDIVLSKGSYNITLYGGTGRELLSGNASKVDGNNINMYVSVDNQQSQQYSTFLDTLLNINLGNKGVTNKSLGTFEYPKENAPSNCVSTGNDIHQEIWEYECFEWGEDGKIIIEPK